MTTNSDYNKSQRAAARANSEYGKRLRKDSDLDRRVDRLERREDDRRRIERGEKGP
jgi:hypothetical protein